MVAQLDAVEPAAHADPVGQVQLLHALLLAVEVKEPAILFEKPIHTR